MVRTADDLRLGGAVRHGRLLLGVRLNREEGVRSSQTKEGTRGAAPTAFAAREVRVRIQMATTGMQPKRLLASTTYSQHSTSCDATSCRNAYPTLSRDMQVVRSREANHNDIVAHSTCLLYTSDAADE